MVLGTTNIDMDLSNEKEKLQEEIRKLQNVLNSSPLKDEEYEETSNEEYETSGTGNQCDIFKI